MDKQTKAGEITVRCQIQSVPQLSEGMAEVGPRPLSKRVKLFLKRVVPAKTKRSVKKKFDQAIRWFIRKDEEQEKAAAQSAIVGKRVPLKAGDLVRVRSLPEIESTLNSFHELKGCGFFREMEPYAGTVQRVLKPVERFVDERDYQVKKSRGIVLLEGVMCQGAGSFGKCDRACFFFWREEWLQKHDADETEGKMVEKIVQAEIERG